VVYAVQASYLRCFRKSYIKSDGLSCLTALYHLHILHAIERDVGIITSLEYFEEEVVTYFSESPHVEKL
jgi:hypothetical protein